VKNNRVHLEVVTLLSRERGQARPESTFTLSVLSGSTVLVFTGLSGGSATALTGLVRLFV